MVLDKIFAISIATEYLNIFQQQQMQTVQPMIIILKKKKLFYFFLHIYYLSRNCKVPFLLENPKAYKMGLCKRTIPLDLMSLQ